MMTPHHHDIVLCYVKTISRLDMCTTKATLQQYACILQQREGLILYPYTKKFLVAVYDICTQKVSSTFGVVALHITKDEEKKNL